MHKYTIIGHWGPMVRDLVGVLSWIALVGLVVLPCLGIIPAGYAGWITHPPVWYAEPRQGPERQRAPRWRGWRHFHWRAAGGYASRSLGSVGWQVWLLVTLSIPLSLGEQANRAGVSWWAYGALGVPVVRWLVGCSAVAWPYWGQSRACRDLRWGLYRLYQLTVLGLVAVGVTHLGQVMGARGSAGLTGGGLPLAMGS
ncbi:MAG: hypothetical protein ACE5LU_24895, partial [Anaerolineae bacterium]